MTTKSRAQLRDGLLFLAAVATLSALVALGVALSI
jgi:hypothetical protein